MGVSHALQREVKYLDVAIKEPNSRSCAMGEDNRHLAAGVHVHIERVYGLLANTQLGQLDGDPAQAIRR